MEFLKKNSEFVIPKKRLSDDANDRKIEEFRKSRTMVSECPPPKIRTGVEIICTKEGHDVKKPKVITTFESLGKPLKILENADSPLEKMTSHWNNKELGINKPNLRTRQAGKVKFWDPYCSEKGDAHEQKYTTTFVSWKEKFKREKIQEAMSLFDEVYEQLFQENRLKPKGEKIAHWRVPVEAAKMVKQKLKWMDIEKVLGPICGVQVGDKFKFRSQLQMVGLHCQSQSGIDYTMIEEKNLAISIVDSHRYLNESRSSDMLIYSGQGGLGFLGRKSPPEDQKLERGNLALKNSMVEKTPIRVIRKFDWLRDNKEVFVYDGLYIVDEFTQSKGVKGKIVFKFRLKRVPGQPPLHKMLNAIS